MSHPTKAIVVLLALVASLALVACGGSDEGTGSDVSTATSEPPPSSTEQSEQTAADKPSIPTIVIRDGEPVGGVQELEYSAGDEVEFSVRSDVADEIHVHGYDLSKDVKAGGSVSFSFPAEIEGIFEVELHEGEAQIAELRVNP